jgi:ATP-dependent Lon protease
MTTEAVGQKSILIVDDEKLIRWSLSELFRREFKVYSEGSAEEALTLLSQVPVDIILTDLKMPGMDGLEFIDLLGRKYPEVRIYALTAYASPRTVQELLARGARRVLSKPFDLNVIREMIAAPDF